MTGAEKGHFKHSFQPARMPACETPPGARHKNNPAFRSRALLSPCCEPLDLQSRKRAGITSGLMGPGWEQAQALEKDRARLPAPASQLGDQTSAGELGSRNACFGSAHFPQQPDTEGSPRAAFPFARISLPRCNRPGLCYTGISREGLSL